MLFFGKRCELFVDNYLIEESENIRFKANEPKCVKKVISFDKPWETEGSTGVSVFRDDKNIKMYYRGFPSVGNDQNEMQTSCFAESDDGVNFERAKVNMIDYNGEKENNIVFMGTNAHNFAPFYDTNPNCKPEERYKAIGGVTGGIHVYSSPDGIHWTEMADGAVITDGAFDSMNIAFYDENDKLYRCYSRREERSDVVIDPTLLSDIRSDVTVPRAVLRAIQVCVSTDFIHWSQPMLIEYDRLRDDHLYTNASTCIPGAEHIKISVPMRFHPKRIKLESYEGIPGKAKYNGVSDAVLMTSRDGLHWNRTVKDAWIRAGFNEREWTQRNFIALAGIIVEMACL